MSASLPNEYGEGVSDLLTTLAVRIERLRVSKGWERCEFSLSTAGVLAVIYEPVAGHIQACETEAWDQPGEFCLFLENL